MLRRTLIFVLTLSSIGTTVAAALSLPRIIHGWIHVGGGTDFHVLWADGLIRVLVFRSDRPLEYMRMGRTLYVQTDVAGLGYSVRFLHPDVLRNARYHGNPVPAFAWNPPGQVPGPFMSYIANGFVRFPAWIPPVLFLVYPFCVFVRNRIAARRQMPGACNTCGYDLTGNIAGRCPECGNIC